MSLVMWNSTCSKLNFLALPSPPAPMPPNPVFPVFSIHLAPDHPTIGQSRASSLFCLSPTLHIQLLLVSGLRGIFATALLSLGLLQAHSSLGPPQPLSSRPPSHHSALGHFFGPSYPLFPSLPPQRSPKFSRVFFSFDAGHHPFLPFAFSCLITIDYRVKPPWTSITT